MPLSSYSCSLRLLSSLVVFQRVKNCSLGRTANKMKTDKYGEQQFVYVITKLAYICIIQQKSLLELIYDDNDLCLRMLDDERNTPTNMESIDSETDRPFLCEELWPSFVLLFGRCICYQFVTTIFCTTGITHC